MAVPCNAGSVVGHYCPSQSRTQLYSGARTDALDPNEGARHQKEIRGINGAGEVSSRPSERRNRKINNQVRESERRTAQRIRAQSCSRVRPSNPWRNKRDPHLPEAG